MYVSLFVHHWNWRYSREHIPRSLFGRIGSDGSRTLSFRLFEPTICVGPGPKKWQPAELTCPYIFSPELGLVPFTFYIRSLFYSHQCKNFFPLRIVKKTADGFLVLTCMGHQHLKSILRRKFKCLMAPSNPAESRNRVRDKPKWTLDYSRDNVLRGSSTAAALSFQWIHGAQKHVHMQPQCVAKVVYAN